MSVSEQRARPAETVAGFLSTGSIVLSLVAVAYRPVRLLPFAFVLALVAAGIGGRHERIAQVAVGVGALCFLVGMTVVVVTNHPLW